MNIRASQKCNVVPYFYSVYRLRPVSSGFLLARKCSTLTGWDHGYEMRDYANMSGDMNFIGSNWSGFTVHSLYCGRSGRTCTVLTYSRKLVNVNLN